MTQRKKPLFIISLLAAAIAGAGVAAKPPSPAPTPADSGAAPAADPNKTLAQGLAKRALELRKTGKPEDLVQALKLLETAAELFPDQAVIAARDKLRQEVTAAQAQPGTDSKQLPKSPDSQATPATVPSPATDAKNAPAARTPEQIAEAQRAAQLQRSRAVAGATAAASAAAETISKAASGTEIALKRACEVAKGELLPALTEPTVDRIEVWRIAAIVAAKLNDKDLAAHALAGIERLRPDYGTDEKLRGIAGPLVAMNVTAAVDAVQKQRAILQGHVNRASEGDARAYADVGQCLMNGTGIMKNEIKAIEWYKQGAEAGDSRAMALLGLAYEFGQGGLPKDQAQADAWYAKGGESATKTAKAERVAAIESRTPKPGSTLVNTIGATLVYIPAGSFVMGSPADEPSREDDEAPHSVTLTKGFYVGKTEVTQAQWKAVMGNNPSNFKGDTLPVENVSWDDCLAFCRKLSDTEKKRYRLPTEAEWEYACRAGTTTPFHTGPTIADTQANYDGNHVYRNGQKGQYRQRTTATGTFPPNAFGLHDMHGNVWEWCSDWYGPYTNATTDPKGATTGTARVLRGGSWNINPDYCRSANRDRDAPVSRYDDVGFRLVLDSE